MIKFNEVPKLNGAEKQFVVETLKPLLKQNNIVKVRGMLQDIRDDSDESTLIIQYWLLYYLKDDYFKGFDKIFPSEFQYMDGIISMAIPNWITYIGDAAHWGCDDLTEIVIPKSVKYIGTRAFSFCPLKKVDIPDGVDTIYSKTFYGCRNLESVVIPKSVKYIEGLAFCDCDSLKQVSVPKNTGVDIGAFSKHTIIDRY